MCKIKKTNEPAEGWVDDRVHILYDRCTRVEKEQKMTQRRWPRKVRRNRDELNKYAGSWVVFMCSCCACGEIEGIDINIKRKKENRFVRHLCRRS